MLSSAMQSSNRSAKTADTSNPLQGLQVSGTSMTSVSAGISQRTVSLGDFDGDGKFSTSDYASLLESAKRFSRNGEYTAVADMNQDGKIDMTDVHALLTKRFNGETPTTVTLTDVNGNGKIDAEEVTSKQTSKIQVVDDNSITLALQSGGTRFKSVALGDASGDGEIDVVDIGFIRQHLLSLKKLEGDDLINADANQDGKVDIVDFAIFTDKVLYNDTRPTRITLSDLNNDGAVDMKDVRAARNMRNRTLLGDANGDGVVNARDYAVMRDYAEGIRSEVQNADAADMNLDGVVDWSDIAELVKLPIGTEVNIGDVNADGVVNAEDATDLRNYLNRLPSNYSLQYNADVNGDGRIDMDDVSAILVNKYHFLDTALYTEKAYSNSELTAQENSDERVDAGDRVRFLAVDEANRSVQVEYPAGNTTKIRWVSMKVFEPSTDYINQMIKQRYNLSQYATARAEAYSAFSLTTKQNSYERVDRGDRVLFLDVNEANRSVKVSYPAGNKFKIRWVSMDAFAIR